LDDLKVHLILRDIEYLSHSFQERIVGDVHFIVGVDLPSNVSIKIPIEVSTGSHDNIRVNQNWNLLIAFRKGKC